MIDARDFYQSYVHTRFLLISIRRWYWSNPRDPRSACSFKSLFWLGLEDRPSSKSWRWKLQSLQPLHEPFKQYGGTSSQTSKGPLSKDSLSLDLCMEQQEKKMEKGLVENKVAARNRWEEGIHAHPLFSSLLWLSHKAIPPISCQLQIRLHPDKNPTNLNLI